MRKAKQNKNKHIYILPNRKYGIEGQAHGYYSLYLFLKKGKASNFIQNKMQQYIMENQQYLKHV